MTKSKSVFRKILVVTLLSLAFFLTARIFVSGSENAPQKMFLNEIGSTKAVIFNGDDLGRTYANDVGIINSYAGGELTSMSFMAPAPERDEALKLIGQHPGIDAGVHLVLVRDRPQRQKVAYGPITPAQQVPSIVDDRGNFHFLLDFIPDADYQQMQLELDAQIKFALQHGVDVTHLDCHKFFCDKFDSTTHILLELAKKYRLPVRWTGNPQDPRLVESGVLAPDHFRGIISKTYDDKKNEVIGMLDNLPDGITEIMLHPGTKGEERKYEMELMFDPDVRMAIQRNNIHLMGFRELRDFQRGLPQRGRAAISAVPRQ